MTDAERVDAWMSCQAVGIDNGRTMGSVAAHYTQLTGERPEPADFDFLPFSIIPESNDEWRMPAREFCHYVPEKAGKKKHKPYCSPPKKVTKSTGQPSASFDKDRLQAIWASWVHAAEFDDRTMGWAAAKFIKQTGHRPWMIGLSDIPDKNGWNTRARTFLRKSH